MNRSVWNAALALAWLPLATAAQPTPAASTNLSFAEGKIVCAVVAQRGSIPELVLSVLPIAMNAALEHVGAPPGNARLTIRLQEPPPFYKRARALFRVEAFAIQNGDDIALQAGDDPLKLAFRIAHELSHWLVYQRHSVRPPLWLDEGLASLVGAAAAHTCARVHQQDLERPQPAKLADNLFGLDELTALPAYPKSGARSAAFYWQAERLVQALRGRLGPREFEVFWGLLCAPDAPNWQKPLRERWYFSDWDFAWLAEQIRPKIESHNVQ